MRELLKVNSVSKRFGMHRALKDVNISLEEGQVLGLLGPNGCGKSTLFRIILGFLKADAGAVEVLGLTDPEEYRRLMGVALDEGNFDPQMTGLGNLKTTAAIKGLREEDFMPHVETLDLMSAMNKRVGKYSFGMKKRLSIVAALMGDHKLLLLDEPGNGLDVPGNLLLRKLIKDLSEKGTTIFLTSHLLTDVEKTCSHVLLMRDGQIIDQGRTADIIGTHANLEDSFIQKVL